MRSDIFFLSYDEPNAEKNWAALQKRFPASIRMHGITGIHSALIECANRSHSDFFYIVDADNEVCEDFDFSYVPKPADAGAIHVWRCRNAVNDLVYGYGAIKLMPKTPALRLNAASIDASTSALAEYKIMPALASITHFNADAYRAWRGAFRECVKLASGIISKQNQQETETRLHLWCTKGEDRLHGMSCLRGARAGREYGRSHQQDKPALARINDFNWLRNYYDAHRGN